MPKETDNMTETPAPLLQLMATVRMNEQEAPYDGGRLVLHADDAEAQAAGLVQAEVIVNAATDEFLAQFPATRRAMEARRFRITVEEVPEGPEIEQDGPASPRSP